MELRAQVAFHFKFDPAKSSELPETITRTVNVGEEIKTEKVSLFSIGPEDRRVLLEMMQAAKVEATRTAKPAGTTAPVIVEEENSEEEAF